MATLFQPLLATIGTNGQSTYKFDPFCRDWVDLKNNISQPISHKTRVNPIPFELVLFAEALLLAIPARWWRVIEVNSVAPADVVPHDRADELQVAHPRPEPVEVDGLVTLSSGH